MAGNPPQKNVDVEGAKKRIRAAFELFDRKGVGAITSSQFQAACLQIGISRVDADEVEGDATMAGGRAHEPEGLRGDGRDRRGALWAHMSLLHQSYSTGKSYASYRCDSWRVWDPKATFRTAKSGQHRGFLGVSGARRVRSSNFLDN